MKMPINTMLRMTRRGITDVIIALTPPVIGGGAYVGAELDTVTASTWGEAVTLTYQWYRETNPISGATSEAYTVTSDDVGFSLLRRDIATAGPLSRSQTSNSIGPIVATPATQGVNIDGLNLKTGTNIATLTGYSAGMPVRFSKPSVATSGGLLTWDAYSRWSTDGNPTAGGLPWLNDFSIYGNNGGADVLLFTFPATQYVNAAAALAGVGAMLPFDTTGYATYKVVGFADSPANDNRGGLSIKVEVT